MKLRQETSVLTRCHRESTREERKEGSPAKPLLRQLQAIAVSIKDVPF